MSWFTRLRNVFRPARLAEDIDEEMRFHVEMRALEYADQGLTPREAEARARRAFGNPLLLRERTRDADVWAGLDTFLQDVRHSFRMLRRSPGFTAAAVVTLALGIGANTAVFSVVNAVLLRPLPYPHPDRLFLLFQLHEQADVGRTRAAALDFLDWQKRSRSFEAMAGHVGTGFTLSGDGEPELVIGQLVSAELFDVLRVRPLLGRTFRRDENEAGRNQILLLSHGLWRRRYGGDPAVVGRTVLANGKPYTVVGVMPARFDYPGGRYQLWAPLPFRGTNSEGLPINRDSRYLQVVGRLKAGITPEQARAELAALGRSLSQEYPESNQGTTIDMASLTEETVGPVRPALLLLLAAAGFVLLIACANVTSLLLARASTRKREMAVRSALGAGTSRLVRQMLTETLVLFGSGLAAGLLVAQGILSAVRVAGPRDIPRLEEAAIDPRALLFAAAVAAVAALIFGLVPAFQAARAGAAGAGSGRVVTAGPGHQRFRSAVIVAEVGVSLVLLTGAGLAVRSFYRLQGVEKGFNPEHAMTFDVMMPPTKYQEAAQMRAFYRSLLDQLGSQLPFEAVGFTTALPLSGQDLENAVFLEGAPADPSGKDTPVAGLRGVSPGYLEALGIPLRRGRSFTAGDREGTLKVALVNEAFVRRYWPNQNPIGKRLSEDGPEGPWRTVVGVVSDVRHRSLDAAPRPEVLLPYLQLEPSFLTSWARGLSTVVRSSAEPSVAADLIRRGVRAVDPGMPVIELRPMEQVVAESAAQSRFRTLLMAGFALVASALALVGVFGVTSYFVAQRTQEMGVRMALGARSSDVLALVLGRGARLAGLGVLLGLVGAVGLTRWMAGLLFEVSPTDPASFLLAAGLLTAAALAACYFPARRAARVDPAIVLRQD
ncbi:MAG TPA: ABC transporter permease [Thermoanaerobaculia bacterium]|jgi:predicted permease|nr:ABC transporter permease [Thermoanaerobaculia bacterium]